MPESSTDVAAWVRESVHGSLIRLRISKLYGLLLHRSQQLLGAKGEAIYRALVALKDQGKVEKLGVSIYDPYELDALWSNFQLDLVQAPFNIVDRRLASSGWLTRPAAFNRWQSLWQQWHGWLDEQSMPALQACLGFALSQPEIDRIVVGVDNLKQLQEVLARAQVSVVPPPTALMSEDPELINPSRWNAP